MAQPSKEFLLRELNFRVTMWDPETSLTIFHALAKALGPAFALIMDEMKAQNITSASSFLSADISTEKLGVGLRTALDALPPSQLLEITRKLRDVTSVQYAGAWVPLEGVYNPIFAGKMKLYMQWVWEGLKVQYSDFFE